MEATKLLKEFFERYEKGSHTLDLEIINEQYEDSFMFADPLGSQIVEKQKFLATLPKRREFFKMLGHQSTKIVSTTETQLDEQYILVRASFLMKFQQAEQIETKLDSTFILNMKTSTPRIMMQIEHQNLQKTMKELGLLPSS